MLPSFDAPLLWGSILPGLLICTYLQLHIWEATRKKIFRKMRLLSNTGCSDAVSALKLGYILHYIEDYFTYAHNSNYEGILEEHIKYENGQAKWISSKLINSTDAKDNKRKKDSGGLDILYTDIDDVIGKLEELHEEYMTNSPGIENDMLYASRAVSMVCGYYAYAFARNEKRSFEFPLIPDMDRIVDIPYLITKISSMTFLEIQAA